MADAKKHEVRRIVRDLGPDWGRALQDQIVEAAAAHARARLASKEFNPAENSIEVRVPVWVTMSFPVRDGDIIAGDGGVRCHCAETQPGVCVCTGPGAGSCDCPVLEA
jgi:hypothetical protein